MGARLTEADCEALASEFPELICSTQRQIIWGTLSFSCSHVLGSGTVEIGGDGPNCLEDSYEIRIDFTRINRFGCPKVFEESGRIIKWAEEEVIDPSDLHINKDDSGSCCLGIFPEFQWKSVSDFIHHFVIPFFYWQSYRKLTGSEPWEGYSHNDVGITEAMSMRPDGVSKATNRNAPCPCGSGRKYKRCCRLRDERLRRHLSRRPRISKTL